jgi:hypothetical protein
MNLKKLEELPFRFRSEYSETKVCGCLRKESITYQLKLDFVVSYLLNGKCRKNYRLYYVPIFYQNFNKKPNIIGNNAGKGDCLEVLIDNLKIIIKPHLENNTNNSEA